MRGLSLPVRRGSVVWPGGMLLLYFHHATAVDLCNRDRNPSTDGVPSRTASYSVTRLAQNSSRLQPESRSIGHKTRPSLPPRYCLSLPLPRLCQTRACNRISTSFQKRRLTKTGYPAIAFAISSGYFALRLFHQYATSSIFLLLQWLTQLGSCGGKDTATQCFLAQISGKLPR